MRVGPVIVNSTPLVALWVLGRLDLLRELYDEVLIPQAVYEEFVATERAVRQAALENAPWIRPVSLANPQRARVYIGLDLGEAALHGLLAKLRDLGLPIVSVSLSEEADQEAATE